MIVKDVLEVRRSEIKDIMMSLSEEEIIEACESFSIKKWNRLKNSDYWKEKEDKKPGKATW